MTRNRTDTSQRILNAAFDLLTTEGFAGFGINSVARAAGCDKKLIYRYFDGLEGLWTAMGEQAAQGLVDALTPSLDPAPTSYAELVERLVIALYQMGRSDGPFRQIKMLEIGAPPDLTDQFRTARGQVLSNWIGTARGDLAPAPGLDAPALNAILIAAAEGLAMTPPAGLDTEGQDRRIRDALGHLVRNTYAP